MPKLIRSRVFYLLISLLLLLSLLLSVGCGSASTTRPQATGTVPAATHSTSQGSSYTSRPAPTYTTVTIPNGKMPQPTLSVAIPPSTWSSSPNPNDNIGFAVGGAKDIQNFRENIRNNYLPLPTDVTYEGLFYDYYFDTGAAETQDKLFYPSYSTAVTRDPISGEIEYYLSVGLNSGMKESDFQRKKLNLVIVLDVSGSMGDAFNEYYYDAAGVQCRLPENERGKQKIQVARESVVALLDQLNDDDSVGIVLFNSDAWLVKTLRSVDGTNMNSLKNDILNITAGGSTNLDAGLDLATDLYDGLTDTDTDEYENRIIILTDAQPNTGDYSQYGLLGAVKANAKNYIYSSFIGIGVDFNSELVDGITKVRGANYYSVHSSYQFRQRLVDEFDYMVTPLVFNLQLNLEAPGWEIEEVYGSPEANRATGELMKVNTLFPAATEGGETRGGLVLLKLKKTGTYDWMYLKASYEDRNNRYDESQAVIKLEDNSADYFDNSGIRKGVLLTRYADLLKTWLVDERNHSHYGSNEWEPCINDDTGIFAPSFTSYSQWERISLPLSVSWSYEHLFSRFLDYFSNEAETIGDNDLSQEIDILETLIHK